MTPAAIIRVEAFPLTPNGKIDRNQLALSDDRANRTSDSVFVAPRTVLEKLVADLWRGCLQVREIGVHDNFFDLGGNSLSIVQLTLEIERAAGVCIPSSSIFEAPTVGEMAKALADQKPKTGYSPLVPLRPGRNAPPVFMIPSMFGSVAELIPIARALAGQFPIYGIQARGLDGAEPPHDRVEAMADCYVEAVKRVQPHGPYFFVGKCFGGVVAIEMARRLLEDGEEIGLLAALDAFPHPRFWPIRLRMGHFGVPLVRNSFGTLRTRRLRDIAGRIAHAPQKFAMIAKGELSFLNPPETLPFVAKAVFQAAVEAQAQYEPSYYPGKVDFLMCGYHKFVPNAHSWVWRKWVGAHEEASLPIESHSEPKRAHDVASWVFDRLQRATSPPARSAYQAAIVSG